MQLQHSGSRNFRSNKHQRQDGSAAQNKMRDKVRDKMQQGKIFFEKTLTASSLPPHSQVVLPALFVQQHGDKMHWCVTLKNVENDKKWIVEINVSFPQNRPQALLYYGWKAFAIANDLAIGDRLTFVLVAQSKFDVFILHRGANSSLSVEKPKIRSREPIPTRRVTNPEAKLRLGPHLSCDIPTNGCEKSELTKTGTPFTKETAKETNVADVASEAPDSSQSPSGMNTHCFEPMIKKEECIICQIAAMTRLGMMKTVEAGFHTIFNE